MRECRAQLSDAVKVTTVGIFQFFPSCCRTKTATGWRSWPGASFNSFPVAAHRLCLAPSLLLSDSLSILSQLLPRGAGRCALQLQQGDFQFFPSCCLDIEERSLDELER